MFKNMMIVPVLFLLACGPTEEQLKISALDHFNRGNQYYQNKQLAKAAAEYKKAIVQDPEQERFHYNLGLVYYSLNLFDKAIKEYKSAIEINPLFTEAWYNLALAFEKTDDTEQAFWAYEKYKTLSQQKMKKKIIPIKTVVKSNS